jgi:septal ring-binding cell division protein DamX
MIGHGEAEQVRTEVPTLLSQYPNNPGVLYLQGMVTQDGAEAVRIYQSIVDNFPKSEWADDALYKVYQFYYAIGLYRTAELKMNQLKKDYPNSKFVSPSAEQETAHLAEEQDAPVVDASQATTVRPETSEVKSLTQAPIQGQFTLQVGAYTTQVNAEKQKLFFEDIGYAVEVINKVKDGRSLFLVHVGNYTTYDEAKVKGAGIKKTYNVDSIVVTR